MSQSSGKYSNRVKNNENFQQCGKMDYRVNTK